MRENRQHERTSAIIKVNYSSSGALKMDYAQNISRGGLFLATNNPFTLGQEIELHLRTPGNKAPVAVPGVVRWIGERGTPAVKGIGIQFKLDQPNVKEQIETMIEALDEPDEVLKQHQEGISVLILDPNEFASELYAKGIQKMLKRGEGDLDQPVHVHCVSDQESALKHIKDHPCHLLMVELKSKEFDGLKFIRSLRASKGESFPIFAVSRPYPQDRFEALEAGATAFLNKPLQLQTLFNTLIICLQDHGAV